MNPDEIKEKAHALAAAGASAEEIEQFVQSATGQAKEPKLPTKLDLAKRNAAMPHPEDMEDPDPTYAQQALGGIASMARDIPGLEAAQAGARALVRGQSYTDSLADIRSAEDAAPKWVRRGNRLAGASVAAAATGKLPGATTIARQGAIYGGLSGALKADPVSGQNRFGSAVLDATIGAIIPKVLQGAGTAVRTALAPSLGKTALTRTAEMEAADAVNYGAAAREGNISATQALPPDVQTMMNEPDIAPFIKEVRSSRTMQGANPAAIIRKAYELMTERQQLLKRQSITSGDYKAGSELEAADLAAAKRRVLNASDNIMPSLRPAVYAHAAREGERDAFNAAADATKRIVSGNSGAGKKLDGNSPEALQDLIENMSPAEAKAALQGVLGRAKELPGVSRNPVKLFGAPQVLSKNSKVAPYIEALDKKAAVPLPLFGSRGSVPANLTPEKVSEILRALSLASITGR